PLAQAAAHALPGRSSFCTFTSHTANHRRFLSEHGVWRPIILSGEARRNKITHAVLYLYFNSHFYSFIK
ncbi:hypothetical protein ACTVNK_21700, partial [Serratia nevei]